MIDHVSKKKRREIMQAVKSKNTAPELIVRRLAFSMGYRYRLHRRDLPGSPDLVFPGRKKVIFVHGCFWHGHRCKKGKPPKSRMNYWIPKIQNNKKRDAKVLSQLRKLGWSYLRIWQCQLKDLSRTKENIRIFLEN